MIRRIISQTLAKISHQISTTNFISNKEKKWLIWNSEIILPKKHHLKQLVFNYPNYQLNLQKIADLLYVKDSTFTFLDIGGNIGDTAQLLNQHSPKKIISVEPEDYYFNFLVKNTSHSKNISTFQVLLTDDIIENYSLKSENGTAVPHISESANINSTIINKTLDQFVVENNINKIGLIKIDTDGFDLKIIASGFNSIQKDLPILFFELDPYYYEEHNIQFQYISESLFKLSYRKIVFYDFQGGKLVTLDLINNSAIEELIDYVRFKNNSIPYFDVAIFPECHIDILAKL